MSAFTCITCRVAFADAELQRGHYKTDWHRYNLKRRVAELLPVDAENFQQRVLAQRAQVAEQGKDTSGHCAICNKHFSTQNAYENHLQSKKHKDAESKKAKAAESQVQKRNEKNQEKGLDVLPENVKVTEKNAINQELKKQAESSVREGSGTSRQSSRVTSGRSSTSGVVAEDEDMDSDAESCESWAGDALGLEECLFCSHTSASMEKNVTHMTVKHSFFIPDVEFLTDLEGLLTYLGQKVGEGNICLWCNEKGKSFLSSRSVQQHMVDKGHCKMLHDGVAVFEYADYYDYRKSYPDYKEGEAKKPEPMEEGEEGEKKEEEEEEVDEEVLLEQGYQLVLPSGAAVGHRSMLRYYRQKLRQERPRSTTAVTKLMAQYKALGWSGTMGPGTKKRAIDVAYVQRIRARERIKYGMKANFQKHYREQHPF